MKPQQPTYLRKWPFAPHPRQEDIEKAQPPMKPLTGIGNWNQYSKFMMDNEGKR